MYFIYLFWCKSSRSNPVINNCLATVPRLAVLMLLLRRGSIGEHTLFSICCYWCCVPFIYPLNGHAMVAVQACVVQWQSFKPHPALCMCGPGSDHVALLPVYQSPSSPRFKASLCSTRRTSELSQQTEQQQGDDSGRWNMRVFKNRTALVRHEHSLKAVMYCSGGFRDPPPTEGMQSPAQSG